MGKTNMYTIIDWTTFGFVVELGTDTVMTWETKEEAEKYGEDELQMGLWKVIKIPSFAIPYKP
jgi:hypothetical protein